MNTTLKILTIIRKHKIENKIKMAEEQQDFRKNQSTIVPTYIIDN